MKKTQSIPANLSTNLKNSLDFYKNIFNYKNILLLNDTGDKFDVLIQTNVKKFSDFDYSGKKLKIVDKVYLKQNLSKRFSNSV